MSESGSEISRSKSDEQDVIKPRKSESELEKAYSQSSASSSDNLLSTSERSPMRPRKRKLSTAVKHSPSRVKRVRPDYRDEYRKLYNEEIANVIDGPTNDEEAFETSQYGLSVWNSSEKATFFRSLDRRGRHELQGIAHDVGSKSEPEIFQYLKLLQRSLAKECSRVNPPISLRRPPEAAFELNPECVEALDRCADALSALQQRDEETSEINRHGDMWLLTSSIGRWAEGCIKDEGRGAELVSSLPEAEILNLKSFLDLSKTFFMNSSDPEYDWRSYTERVQGPTIRKTAFTDFHTVATRLTQKIIKSAIFVASSRIRATESSFYEVQRKDVTTALNILGITLNVKDYWIGLARRCNLRVYNEVRRSRSLKKEFSYDEVEDLLTLKRADFVTESRSRGQESGEFTDSGSDHTSESGSALPIRSAAKLTSSRSSSSTSAPELCPSTTITGRSDSPINVSDSELLQIQEDSDLDDLDLEESAREELRLYHLLDIQHQANDDVSGELGKEVKDAKIANKSSHIFRAPEIQDDWTSWIEYQAEWENPAGPVPQWKFVGVGEQRRRRESVDLADERLGDMKDRLENGSDDSNVKSTTAGVESDIDSIRVRRPSRSVFKHREQSSEGEQESDFSFKDEDDSVSSASRSPSDLSQEDSTEDEGEAELQEDEEKEDGSSADEWKDEAF